MKKIHTNSITTAVIITITLGFTGPIAAFAATTPTLGIAGTFGILGSTYTNTVAGTTITGDLGYVTGPATAPTVSGTTHINDGTFAQAGTDQGTALTNLNSQACTFTFASGAIDLATDTTHGPIGVYTPGVYCTAAASAASIGVGGITLSGNGTYIFRVNGALTTVANSVVTRANGASANDVFWTPTSATTLGANSTFIGTVIDDSGITIGSTVTWRGRALAFGGTVSTDVDTITTPTTLHVIKLVVNGSGGTAIASNFNVHVKLAGIDVAGSPIAGAAAPGTTFPLSAGTYVVSEDANASYVQSFSGACNSSGVVTLVTGDDKICTIINTDIPAPPSLVPVTPTGIAARYVPNIGVVKVPTPLALPGGSGSVTYGYTVWNVGGMQALINVTVADDKCSPLTLLSGDVNSNSKLDPDERWNYSCNTTLSQTTTNTVVATGYSDDGYNQAAIATAVATVVVGAPMPAPLISIIKVPSRSVPFPFGGGNVTYTYVVTNPGVVAMSNVSVTDDKCASVSRNFNDANLNGNNNNNLLEPGESWAYTCQTNIVVSTRNVATAEGRGNGFTALGYAFATVLVSAPGLPNTGFPSHETSVRDVVMLASVLTMVLVLRAILLRKRTI